MKTCNAKKDEIDAKDADKNKKREKEKKPNHTHTHTWNMEYYYCYYNAIGGSSNTREHSRQRRQREKLRALKANIIYYSVALNKNSFLFWPDRLDARARSQIQRCNVFLANAHKFISAFSALPCSFPMSSNDLGREPEQEEKFSWHKAQSRNWSNIVELKARHKRKEYITENL